jgi:hypothetical protein
VCGLASWCSMKRRVHIGFAMICVCWFSAACTHSDPQAFGKPASSSTHREQFRVLTYNVPHGLLWPAVERASVCAHRGD